MLKLKYFKRFLYENKIAFIILGIFVILGLIVLIVFSTRSVEEIQQEIQYNKIEQYHNKLTSSIENLVEPTIQIEPIINYEKLYELYSTGVPDTYDSSGTLIPGVEPNVSLAISYLNLLIDKDPTNYNYKLDLGKLYHFGAHKFEPDTGKALKIYNSILNEIDRESPIYFEVIDYITDINRSTNHSEIDTRFNDYIVQNEFITIAGNEYPRLTEPEFHENIITIFDIIEPIEEPINERTHYDPNMPRIVQRQRQRQVPAVRNDSQNVHDPTVVSTVKNALNVLKENKQPGDTIKTISEISQIINSRPKNDKINSALTSLGRLNGYNDSFGIAEDDALKLVWDRINTYEPEQKNLAIDSLINELSDMQEHGHTVCSTGKVTRIVDTLNIIDPEIKIVPKFAIHEEMMNKSSSIREKFINGLDSVLKKAYEEGSSPELEQQLKNLIREELHSDYVKTSILTNKAFDTEINKWIDHI